MMTSRVNNHTLVKRVLVLFEKREKENLCIRCLKTQHNQLLFSQLQQQFVTSCR